MENKLLRKLRIKPGFRVLQYQVPADIKRLLTDKSIAIAELNANAFDAAIVFFSSKAALYTFLKQIQSSINEQTIFWVCYPKASAKIPTDLNLMKSWSDLLQFGLSPCASAAIHENWTGIRLKPASAIKASGLSNNDIKANSFGEYIDVDAKTVKLPEDLQQALKPYPGALAFFNSLSYTYRKEYVLWILNAKQQKTRDLRVEKSTQLLQNGVKSP